MYVGCSTQCFASLPLERALRMINELEFSKVDVAIHEDGSHIKPSEVAQDVNLAAQKIRIGPSLSPAAFDLQFNTPEPAELARQWKAIFKLARLSAVTTLTISASGTGVGLDAEVARLTELAKQVHAEGLVLTVATRPNTLTESAQVALELCQRVPNLFLTLDPSPFISSGQNQDILDQLIPHVRHVHLRDTGRGPGKYQVRIGQGEIEYGKIISQLERARYDRLLSVAINDIADAPFVMENEVRKLKFLLESLV